MSQHRKKTRNEMESQISRMLHESERDTKRMIAAARVIEEQTRKLDSIRKFLASPEAEIDPRGVIGCLRLVLEGKL